MTELLVSDQKKIQILKVLNDEKIHSFYNLSKELGTNFNTIKKNCNFLELLGLIEIERTAAEESASGKASYEVRISGDGEDFIESI